MKGLEGMVDECVLANYITGAVQAGIQNAAYYLLENLLEKAKLDCLIAQMFKDTGSTPGRGECAVCATERNAADTTVDVRKTGKPIASAPEWVKDTIRVLRTQDGLNLDEITSVLATRGYPTKTWLVRRWCEDNGLLKPRFPTGKGRKSHAISSWPESVVMAAYKQWRYGGPTDKIKKDLADKKFVVKEDVLNRHFNYIGPVLESILSHTKQGTSGQAKHSIRPPVWTNLCLYRELERLTQADLAAIVHVSSGLISKIERRQSVTLTPSATENFKTLIGPHCTMEWMQAIVPLPEYMERGRAHT